MRKKLPDKETKHQNMPGYGEENRRMKQGHRYTEKLAKMSPPRG